MLYDVVPFSLTNANRAVMSHFLHHIRYYKRVESGTSQKGLRSWSVLVPGSLRVLRVCWLFLSHRRDGLSVKSSGRVAPDVWDRGWNLYFWSPRLIEGLWVVPVRRYVFCLSSIIWVQQSSTYLFLILRLIPVLPLRWSNIPSTINKVSSLLSKHEEVSVIWAAEGHKFSDGQV